MYRGLGTIAILGVFVLSGALVSEATGGDFRRKGSFKGANSDRVYTLQMPAGTTRAEVLYQARRLPYTQGQMTGAHFYETGSVIPADGITRARTLSEVNHILYEMRGLSPWVFAYQRGRNGKEVLVDCREGPSPLCRNE